MSSTKGKLNTLFTPRHTFSQKLFFSAPFSLSVIPFSIELFFPIVDIFSFSTVRPVAQLSVLLRNADFSIVEQCEVDLESSEEEVPSDAVLSDAVPFDEVLSDEVPSDEVPSDAVPFDEVLSDGVEVAEEIFCRISTTADSISL